MSDLISRKEAIEALANLTCFGIEEIKVQCEASVADSEGWIGGIRDAVIELEALPSAEPEPEEFEWCHGCKEYDQEKHCCHRWTKVIRQTVEEMKAHEPERHRGEWIEDGHERGFSECSKCGYTAVSALSERYYNFCPNCGADMR